MTTPEEARAIEIKACDGVLGAPWIVQKMIGAEGRRLAQANRNFWQQADTATLQKLASLLDNEPRRMESDSASAIPCPTPDYKKGWWKIYGVPADGTTEELYFQFTSMYGSEEDLSAYVDVLKNQGVTQIRTVFEES